MNNYLGHFLTICKHRKYVRYACRKCGIPIQGLFHDLSKFSPIEFFESAKYWTGTKSPIEVARRENGYSLAWNHHKGRNVHHWEYWLDRYSDAFGPYPILMPANYMCEMFCDWIGASKTYYHGNNWNLELLEDYYLNKIKNKYIHPLICEYIEDVFSRCRSEKDYYWFCHIDRITEYFHK
jgi:hypothetical protein